MQCCFPFGNTETVRVIWKEQYRDSPLTLEHGYENCMHANEYEFSTETKRS